MKRINSFFFLVLTIVLIGSLSSAETFGYGRTESTPINYSIIPTVNNSLYWDGNAWDLNRWLLIDGSNANTNIDIGNYIFQAFIVATDFIGGRSASVALNFSEDYVVKPTEDNVMDLGEKETGRFKNLYLGWNVTSDWIKGNHFSFTTDTWFDFVNNYNLTFNDSKLTTTYYNATQSEAIAGTIDGGTIEQTKHSDGNYDGVTFNFSEDAGSPGIDLRVNFSGITGFNGGVMRYRSSTLSGTAPII